jgi:hypothetical protein
MSLDPSRNFYYRRFMPSHEESRGVPDSRADQSQGERRRLSRAVEQDQRSVKRAVHLLVLAALSVGVFLLVAPTPAQAQCQGLGHPYDTGTNWGREGANYNTCDGDGWYYGWVEDILTDGYCVVYQWKDDWTDTFWDYAATTCTLNYMYPFHYYTSDHDSGFRICKLGLYTCATPGLSWDF